MKGLNTNQKAALLRVVKAGRRVERHVTMVALVRRRYANWATPACCAIVPTEAGRHFAATGEQLA